MVHFEYYERYVPQLKLGHSSVLEVYFHGTI